MSSETKAPESTQKHQLLKNLGFSEPFDVNGRTSIADLIKPSERCGIYVLHFSTGECYAGLSRNVTSRFQAHQRNYDDIVHISYKPVHDDILEQVEAETIHTLEREGFKLRNVSLTSIPKGESEFDAIMTKSDQDRWLHDFKFVDDAGDRLSAPDLRRKHRRKYDRLLKKPYTSEFLQMMRTYVQLGIPAIRRGELDFWSITCLPKSHVYGRVNINWQEVCTYFIFEEEPFVSFHFASSPFDKYSEEEFLSFWDDHHEAEWIDHTYQPGGQDQYQGLIPASDAQKLLADPRFLEAVRLFNLRLMKKGPNVNGRSHCMDLADNLV